ncbi:biliverdin-producing heme oxygenase [uncultured Chryseobacterium sp.]|uniref:biliverdin-producing heme oxygenase n=1 Tax=uncultured Chryseobacterium sp. TaxID=259322 RepID=UPI0026086E79|nr:biliverdin-producing heme oxygenase [uncultured Chryseobacterium sp.]
MKLVTDFLKDKTAHLHDAAEVKFSSKKVFDKSYSKEDYFKFLNSNYLLYQNFEGEIDSNLNPEYKEKIGWNKRRKLNLLVEEFSLNRHSFSKNFDAIILDNNEQAFGALYVLEGSTLGGNMIKKHLLQNEEFSNYHFLFLGWYGAETGTNWTQLKDLLNTEISEKQFEEALKGAEKVYHFLLAN